MQRRPFYPVPRAAWLIWDKSEQSPEPEEEVRQWCAQELLRAYGFCIADLTFEAQARVGSKRYRIDILVRREGKPWIVMECKQRKHTGHDKAMEQAISYADSARIQAEFAAYTNGTEWRVKRRTAGGWVPIADLPVTRGLATDRKLGEHLHIINTLKPVLRSVDQELKGRRAVAFLESIQNFFNGAQQWCRGMDGGLLDAADNILRVIAGPREHLNYRWEKLIKAAEALERYSKARGLYSTPLTLNPSREFQHELQFLSATWQSCIAPSDGIEAPDIPLTALITALLDYAQKVPSNPGKYPVIPQALHARLRAFLDVAVTIHLGLTLPELDDSSAMNSLRKLCAG
jgi:hypothetical protein